jgi:peptidylprolyl isomerase
VPTEKRQRQKEGHRVRREAALAAARRQNRNRRIRTISILVAAVVLISVLAATFGSNDDGDDTASSTTSTTEAEATTPTSAKPEVPAAGTDPVTELKIEDLKVGDGEEVKAGDTIVAHYLGSTYKDGKEFQASWDGGKTFETAIGTGSVIEGWDKGIPGMKVGGRRKLTIPAAMAYGAEDKGDGRPFGDLVFIIDVYAIK